MTLSLAFIMAFMIASVGALIGFLIFSGVESAIDCGDMMNSPMLTQCENAKNMAWLVIGILPIALFFSVFSMFGGFNGRDESPVRSSSNEEYVYSGKVNVETKKARLETKKARQRRKQKEVDDHLSMYDDKQVHSFISNWFRKKTKQ